MLPLVKEKLVENPEDFQIAPRKFSTGMGVTMIARATKLLYV